MAEKQLGLQQQASTASAGDGSGQTAPLEQPSKWDKWKPRLKKLQ